MSEGEGRDFPEVKVGCRADGEGILEPSEMVSS